MRFAAKAGLVVAGAVALAVAAGARAGGAEGGAPGAAKPAPAASPPGGTALSRFLFFASLEGLFEDGVPEDLVKVILEKDARGGYVNFVYACPLCMPTLDAFRQYAARMEWEYSVKGDRYADDAKPSVLGEIAGLLGDKDVAVRRKGLGALVERYAKRRMDRLRLTVEERASWRQAMALGRKEGMRILESYTRSSPAETHGMERCPTCDGANDWMK